MALAINEQIMEAINRSRNILAVFKKNFSLDSVSSSLALARILKKINRSVEIVADGFQMPANWTFLPNADIRPELSDLRQMIITLNIKNTGVQQFSYNIEDGKLNIFITPKRNTLQDEDIKTAPSRFKYDLIIVLDTRDLDSLGSLYANNAEFFHHTPIINIDHNPTNENFGQINLVNTTSVATTEILYELFQSSEEGLFDKDIAHALLAGMISDTKSFKTGRVTPKSLHIAKELIELGADRQAIVQNLYRQQTLPILKLWGKILARLKSENNDRIVWSIISESDFLETGANARNLAGITDELLSSLPRAEVVVLIYQYKNEVRVRVETLKIHNALALTKKYSPEGDKKIAEFTFADADLVETEKEVIQSIKEAMTMEEVA